MKLSGHTILITGGSEGIGFALANSLAQDNQVLICSRSEQKLQQAKQQCPSLIPYRCDLTDPAQRHSMIKDIVKSYPKLNILINNAGAKRFSNLADIQSVSDALHKDFSINFQAPALLCSELLNHLKTKPLGAIINISSGLIHIPKAEQAFYCAAKSALHSYSQSLRWVLKSSNVKVFEAILPLVDTQFHHQKLPQNISAIQPVTAAQKILQGIRQDKDQIYVGKAILAYWLSLFMFKTAMKMINR